MTPVRYTIKKSILIVLDGVRGRTLAALLTEDNSDVASTSLTGADPHQTLVTVRVTVRRTDRHVDHRALTAGTSTTTPTDRPSTSRVHLTDLTHRTLDPSTRLYTTYQPPSTYLPQSFHTARHLGHYFTRTRLHACINFIHSLFD